MVMVMVFRAHSERVLWYWDFTTLECIALIGVAIMLCTCFGRCIFYLVSCTLYLVLAHLVS